MSDNKKLKMTISPKINKNIKIRNEFIEIVMRQIGVTREVALATLIRNDGDVINSVMDLTM